MNSEYHAPNLTGEDINKNSHDIPQAHVLLHGEERAAYGDAEYQGVEKCEENRDGELASGHAARKTQANGRTHPTGQTAGEAGAPKGQLPCQGGAPVPHREEPAGISEGSLPWTGEEYGAVAQPCSGSST